MKPSLKEWRLISLLRREERRASFLANMPLDYDKKIFSGIEGSSLSAPEGKSQLCGALGCFASHIQLFKDALFEGRDYLVVFEDDAKPTDFFRKHGKRLLDQSRHLPWDLLYLGRPRKDQREGSIQVVGTEWSVPCDGIASAHAYIIKADMMAWLVDRFAPEGTEPPYGPPYRITKALNMALAEGDFSVYYPTRSPLFREDKSLPSDG